MRPRLPALSFHFNLTFDEHIVRMPFAELEEYLLALDELEEQARKAAGDTGTQ